ncbi:MAG: hypothetical protein IJ002_01325 [Clostridia bacterium]|nr:hypothetical protein [Clostridia bacterium]
MSMLAMLLSLFGCGKKAHINTDFPSPVPLPEGETLTALHLTRQGMRGGMYYIMSVEGEEIFFKITNLIHYDKKYRFTAHKRVLENEISTICSTKDTAALRAIEEVLVDCGTVGWDGFNEEISRPGVADSGDIYNVYLQFSGGSSVSVYGYDIFPDRFMEMHRRIAKIIDHTVNMQ